MPITAAAIIGGASLIGGARAQSAQAGQSAKQMRFQRAMSNTAHRRQARDLEKAGLNRILSATGGSGASSPGGAAAPQQDVITPAVSSAMAAKRLAQEIKNLRATEEKTVAETAFVKSKTGIAEPFKAVGEGIGAIATPLSEIIQDLAVEIPASARDAKSFLQKQQEKVKDYLFRKSHKNPVFHKRGEIKR